MDAILKALNEAIESRDRRIDFLREENADLTSRLRRAEARITELEGDYGETEKGDDF